MTVHFAALCGSLRRDSYNRQLLALAAEVARAQGATVDVIEAEALRLPLYDGDVEAAGFPAAVLALKARLRAAQALIVVTPEYNGFFSGVLKNAFDWVSRPLPGDTPHINTKGKPVALLASSPGPMKGLRALPRTREMLAELGCIIPAVAALQAGADGFEPQRKQVADVVTAAISFVRP